MDAADLRRIAAGGETLEVEFKSGDVNDGDLVEAAVCMTNAAGGQIYVGIDDDGAVTGAASRHDGGTDPTRLEALIANLTEPALFCHVVILEVEAGEIIVIEVPRSRSVVATSRGKFLRRAIDVRGRPQCLPMRPHEVLSRAGSIGASDFARVRNPSLALGDLDPGEFDRFRGMARAQGDEAVAGLSDQDLLRALGLLSDDDLPTIGAGLLFGGPEALQLVAPVFEVSFQEIDGTAVRFSRIERWPLLRAMEELSAAVKVRNPEEEIDVGLFRLGLPRFAEVAVREVIANALVHRDYTMPGVTHVQVINGDLVVNNPGGFPEGITMSNLLVAPPRPRNPALADAFKRAGLVERTGRGVQRAFESQLRLGRPAPDYGSTSPTWVEVRLRGSSADRELAAFISQSQRGGQPVDLDLLLVLTEVRRERRISTIRAAELFQVPPETARATLNRLVERGFLEARGEGRGRTYHLAASVYRELGESPQYIRTRGFDQIQHEQMVLTYAQRHGRITRRETAELCQIAPAQAGRLLHRLRDEEKIVMRGERRGAYYEPLD